MRMERMRTGRGVEIVAGTPDGLGTLNTVTHGLLFAGSGAAHTGQYVNMIDGGTSKAQNTIVLGSMTITGLAFNSPGFQIDNVGNVIGRTLATSLYTVATLPTCAAGNTGRLAVVTDLSAAPVYNAAIGAGGGSNVALAFCRNSAWTAH